MARSRSGFTIDDGAVSKLLTGPAARAHLETALDAAMLHVRAAAPQPGVAKYATGDFRGSITTKVVAQTTEHAHKRLVGFIYSTDPIWHLLEYGSVNNKPYRPFARGLERAGLHYQKTAKGGAL